MQLQYMFIDSVQLSYGITKNFDSKVIAQAAPPIYTINPNFVDTLPSHLYVALP